MQSQAKVFPPHFRHDLNGNPGSALRGAGPPPPQSHPLRAPPHGRARQAATYRRQLRDAHHHRAGYSGTLEGQTERWAGEAERSKE